MTPIISLDPFIGFLMILCLTYLVVLFIAIHRKSRACTQKVEATVTDVRVIVGQFSTRYYVSVTYEDGKGHRHTGESLFGTSIEMSYRPAPVPLVGQSVTILINPRIPSWFRFER
jgi:hypothetical protein